MKFNAALNSRNGGDGGDSSIAGIVHRFRTWMPVANFLKFIYFADSLTYAHSCITSKYQSQMVFKTNQQLNFGTLTLAIEICFWSPG